MGLKTWGRKLLGILGGKSTSFEAKDALSGDFAPSGYCAPDSTGLELLDDTGFYPSIGKTYIYGDEVLWENFDDEALAFVYTVNAIVYACCRLISTSFAEPPLELGTFTADDEWKKRKDEWLIKVIQRPNDWYSYYDMTQVQMTRKLLTGASFTWKWRNNADETIELWPIPTHWVTISVGKMSINGYWLFRNSPHEKWIDAPDMIYDRFPSPMNVFGYMGPLHAALHDYLIDSARERYLYKMIRDLIRPGMVIEQNPQGAAQRQGLTDKQRKQLRESLVAQGTGGTAIFPPGLETKFPGAIRDLDWSSTEGMVASRICAAFGVEPILIGVRVGLKSATYSNYDQARRAFYEETLGPLWRSGGETWTRSMIRHELDVLPARAKNWLLRYNLDDVTELQEPKMERMGRGTKALTAGAITVNEYRTKFAGLDKQPDGDVYLRVSNVIPEPIGARLEPAEEEEELAIPDKEEPVE